MTTGNRIKEARKSKGLSQIELAKLTGISVNSIRLYEGNKRSPKVETLELIARCLNVDVYSLADWNQSNELLEHHSKLKQTLYGETHVVIDKIAYCLNLLNPLGQQKAIERVEELTEIKKYKK